MPPQRNTIGVPTINLRHNVQDPEMRRALEQLSQETTCWLQRLRHGAAGTEQRIFTGYGHMS